MGKTKTKIMDDSVQEESKKKLPSKKVRETVDQTKFELAETDDVTEPTSTTNESNKEVGEEPTLNKQGGSDISQLDNSQTKKKSQKQGRSKPRSIKYQTAVKNLDRSVTYSIDEAVDMVKKLSYSKFNGSLEAHIIMGQTGVRGLISLPFVSGRKIRVLAFGDSAPESGADVLGDENTLSEIEKGKINFDVLITTPKWMPRLAKAAKILGPRGLMPSPKNGTITEDLKKAVTEFHSGKTEYKTEGKAPVMHLSVGKLNQPTEELSANIRLLLQTLGKSRIVKVNLSPTMGPSVKLNLFNL